MANVVATITVRDVQAHPAQNMPPTGLMVAAGRSSALLSHRRTKAALQRAATTIHSTTSKALRLSKDTAACRSTNSPPPPQHGELLHSNDQVRKTTQTLMHLT